MTDRQRANTCDLCAADLTGRGYYRTRTGDKRCGFCQRRRLARKASLRVRAMRLQVAINVAQMFLFVAVLVPTVFFTLDFLVSASRPKNDFAPLTAPTVTAMQHESLLVGHQPMVRGALTASQAIP